MLRRPIGVVSILGIPLTILAGMIATYAWSGPDSGVSGEVFLWIVLVTTSLCVVEVRLGALVELMVEKRRGFDKRGCVVDWGNDGFRPEECRPDEGVLVGRVVAHEAVLEGPDGIACVAALRVLENLRHENRWSPFVVETPKQRVLLSIDQERLVRIVAGSWRIEAARPRWFGGAAFAPLAADGERLDWVVVRPGDTVRIEAGFSGEQPLSNERPEVLGGEPMASEKATDSPYRPLAPASELRLRGTGPDAEGYCAPIQVDVVSASTAEWSRRARLHGNLLRIVGVLGVNMLVFGFAGFEDVFSVVPRFVVFLCAAVLLVLRIGKLVADGDWWARRPRNEVVETHERARRSRAYFVLLLAAAPWPIAWAAATSDFRTLAVVVGALALLLFVGLAFAPTPSTSPYQPWSIAPRSGGNAASAAPASGAVSADDAVDADGHERPVEPTP